MKVGDRMTLKGNPLGPSVQWNGIDDNGQSHKLNSSWAGQIVDGRGEKTWWVEFDNLKGVKIYVHEYYMIPEVPPPAPSNKVCVCSTNQLVFGGCICGAYQLEKRK